MKGLNGSPQAQVWGKDKRGCAGLGPTSGMQQVELLVLWQGQRGQAAQPVPSPCPPGLAPSPAHTLSRGLWYTASEIPTIPSSPSGPAHLPNKRHLHSGTLRRGTASKVQKRSQYQSWAPIILTPWGGKAGFLEHARAQDSSPPCRMQQTPGPCPPVEWLPIPPLSLPTSPGGLPPWETKQHSLPNQDKCRFLSGVGHEVEKGQHDG